MTYVKTYEEMPVDEHEIMRYAGVRQRTEALDALLERCLEEALDGFSYKVCYSLFPVTCTGTRVNFGFAEVRSENLARLLDGRTRALIFCATVGMNIDRLIARYSRSAPSRSLFFQAIGAERIEALCDLFESELAVGHTHRFSPGYGDLDLEFQRDIFRALDCPKKIGVSLNGSLLMSPSKSVSAIIGV